MNNDPAKWELGRVYKDHCGHPWMRVSEDRYAFIVDDYNAKTVRQYAHPKTGFTKSRTKMLPTKVGKL